MKQQRIIRQLKHAGLMITDRGVWHEDQRLDAYEKKPKKIKPARKLEP